LTDICCRGLVGLDNAFRADSAKSRTFSNRAAACCLAEEVLSFSAASHALARSLLSASIATSSAVLGLTGALA